MSNRRQDDRDLLRKCDVAIQLGLTRSRVSQLIRDGHLIPNADGLITAEELARCRREACVAWAHPQAKGGRPSAAELERRQTAHQWLNIALRCKDIHDAPPTAWRNLAPLLIAAMESTPPGPDRWDHIAQLMKPTAELHPITWHQIASSLNQAMKDVSLISKVKTSDLEV